MSTLRVNNVLDQAGTGQPSIDGLAKAWVNFNGTGTVAIRASYNVSSITDNGTGIYTVNFTTAMPDASYTTFVNSEFDGFFWADTPSLTTSTTVKISTGSVYIDRNFIAVATFR